MHLISEHASVYAVRLKKQNILVKPKNDFKVLIRAAQKKARHGYK